MRYRVAIVGTGKIAGLYDTSRDKGEVLSHAAACLKIKHLDLVAACDTHRERLRQFSKIWNVQRRYFNVKDLLETERFDIISLCTPNLTHFPLIKSILQHKNRAQVLFVEKPLCSTKQELQDIRKYLAKTDSLILVNHIYRFNIGIQKIATLIKNNTLGDIIFIRATYYGGLLHNGIHIIDILRMLTGSEFRVISVDIVDGFTQKEKSVNVTLACQRFPSAEVIIESFSHKYYQLYEIELRFQKGRVRIMDFCREIYIDKIIINRFGERELKNVEKINPASWPYPFMTVYNSITNYLNKKDLSILEPIGIEEVAKSMAIIWDIERKVKKCKG